MTEMIALKALTKRFGPLVAVDGISLTVAAGEVLCFLGPNGAGKSTTMRMITGFIEPTSGTAEVAGLDVTRHPVEVKRRIGYLPEGAPSYGDMTPGSYLGFIAEIRGFDGAEKRRRIDAVVEKVELASVLHQPIETLSKGFKRRVGLAQAMIEQGGAEAIVNAVEQLEIAVRQDAEYPRAWRLLSIGYGRTDRLGMSSLASAERALLLNDYKDAISFSKRADDLLPSGAPGQLRAQDIEFAAKQALNRN